MESLKVDTPRQSQVQNIASLGDVAGVIITGVGKMDGRQSKRIDNSGHFLLCLFGKKKKKDLHF